MSQSAAKKINIEEIDQKLFESLALKIYQLAGISLPYNDKNVALFNNRLSRLLREFKMSSYHELDEALKFPKEELKKSFISSLTTNKTDFFREEAHFDFLKTQLPLLFKAKSEVRIWSSACSLGSEPYTVALIISDMFQQPFEKSRFKILGTDLDLEVLKRAVTARYSNLEMEGVPAPMKQKYFKNLNNGFFALDPELAKMVHFSEFNLMNHQYRFQKKFDVVFCRNVLIYFDKPTTDKVVDLLVSNLEVKGHLIIGHSESGVIHHPHLKALGNSIFQKVRG